MLLTRHNIAGRYQLISTLSKVDTTLLKVNSRYIDHIWRHDDHPAAKGGIDDASVARHYNDERWHDQMLLHQIQHKSQNMITWDFAITFKNHSITLLLLDVFLAAIGDDLTSLYKLHSVHRLELGLSAFKRLNPISN